MVCGSDVIVSVSFKTSDRILLFKLKVADKTIKKLLGVGHLLETGEKAWLTSLRCEVFLCLSHIDMVSDLRDADARIRIGVQNFANEVLALGGQELGHLVISAHDLFVEV